MTERQYSSGLLCYIPPGHVNDVVTNTVGQWRAPFSINQSFYQQVLRSSKKPM